MKERSQFTKNFHNVTVGTIYVFSAVIAINAVMGMRKMAKDDARMEALCDAHDANK